MAFYTYDYSISGTVDSGQVDPSRLESEIRAESNITIALDGIVVEGDNAALTFRDNLYGQKESYLDPIMSGHSGVPLEFVEKISVSGAQQNDSALLVANVGRIGKEVIYATHNFCDATTWYYESARETSASLADSGDGLTFTSSHECWIDMTGGKLYDEEGLVEDQNIFALASNQEQHGYEVKVWVSGVLKNQRSRFSNERETEGDDWDYEVDYTSGTITFQNTPTGSVVTSYSYKSGSLWTLKPLPNKVLIMEKAEVQFSKDIGFNASLHMDVYGYCVYFAPSLAQSNGGPYPDTTLIPLEEATYKTIDQLIDEAVRAFPPVPALSSGSDRGYTQEKHIFQFHYSAVRKLYSSLGMEVRISIQGNKPWDGERATATFYCTSKDDGGYLSSLKELGLI